MSKHTFCFSIALHTLTLKQPNNYILSARKKSCVKIVTFFEIESHFVTQQSF